MNNIFDRYDHKIKLSICEAAFKLDGNFPPTVEYFHLAREVGYEIPDKWIGLYIGDEKWMKA